jgi:hypothetical protein
LILKIINVVKKAASENGPIIPAMALIHSACTCGRERDYYCRTGGGIAFTAALSGIFVGVCPEDRGDRPE